MCKAVYRVALVVVMCVAGQGSLLAGSGDGGSVSSRSFAPGYTLPGSLLPSVPTPPALKVLAQNGVPDTSPTASGATSGNGNTALMNIGRFELVGNTLLEQEVIDRALEPYKGAGRSFSDIMRALEAIEGAYRAAGYSAVHVSAPEQDVSAGVVVFIVTEAVIGKVTLRGNQEYDSANIRNALPALVENRTPSARQLSENIRLANENPTRSIDVVLEVSDQEGRVDARVNVKDSSPHKVFLTLDNTGNRNTGMYRAGVGYQHNNLFNRDHALTLNYLTAPGHINQVTQLSGSYRLPLYALGDSIDLIAAYTDTDAGTTHVGGPGGDLLTYSGKGRVYGVHYNHHLARQGDYVSKLVGGFDYRASLVNCSFGNLGAAGCGPAAFPVNLHPVSLAYAGVLSKPTHVADYTASVVRNITGGDRGGSMDFNLARPSPTGGAGARADYTIFRLNGSLLGALPGDMQYRIAGNAQYTTSALISGESFGLVGANAVRGFIERELSSDKGYVFNFELYTPELAQELDIRNGSLRLLGFVDYGRGWKVLLAGETPENISVSSIGLGLRFTHGKSLMTKFDWARVVDGGGNARSGDSRGQISMVISW